MGASVSGAAGDAKLLKLGLESATDRRRVMAVVMREEETPSFINWFEVCTWVMTRLRSCDGTSEMAGEHAGSKFSLAAPAPRLSQLSTAGKPYEFRQTREVLPGKQSRGLCETESAMYLHERLQNCIPSTLHTCFCFERPTIKGLKPCLQQHQQQQQPQHSTHSNTSSLCHISTLNFLSFLEHDIVKIQHD